MACVAGPFSGVGVSGTDEMDNLLGPALEPALRRCGIMFFGRAASGGSWGLLTLALGGLESVGVGGVLTISGMGASTDGDVWGGVCGRVCSGSRFGPRESRLLYSAAGLGSGSGSGLGDGAAEDWCLAAGVFSSAELLFDLKTSLRRLADVDRLDRSSGVSRVVRLGLSDRADWRLSVLPRCRVDDLEDCLDSESGSMASG